MKKILFSFLVLIVTTAPALAGPLTTNRVVKYDAIQKTMDSMIYDNGTGIGIGTSLPLATAHINRTSAPGYLFDAPLRASWTYALGSTDVAMASLGWFTDTGSNANSGGHGIGSLGFAQDNAASNMTIYGGEGRANSISLTAGANPIGYAGRGQWSDPNAGNTGTFLGTSEGGNFQCSVFNYDAATPRQQGYCYGVNILSGNGGVINSGLKIASQTSGTFNFGGIISTPSNAALWLGNESAGTTPANGIVWGSGLDVNLYRKGNDLLATDDSFYTGGSVGVGSSSPVGKLNVSSTNSTNNAVDFQVDNSVYGSKFVVTTTGNIGIGINNPTAALGIGGGTEKFSINSAGQITRVNSITLPNVWTNSQLYLTQAGQVYYGNANSGSGAATSVIGGANAASFAEIRSTSHSSSTTDHIKLTVGNNAATEAMRVVHSGAIGIGTNNPGAKVTIVGTGTTSGTKAFEVDNSLYTPKFYIENDGSIYAAGGVYGASAGIGSAKQLWITADGKIYAP